jgi:hypothetical protein
MTGNFWVVQAEASVLLPASVLLLASVSLPHEQHTLEETVAHMCPSADIFVFVCAAPRC